MSNRLYLYIQAQVVPVDPDGASLFNTLTEVASGKPQPDVIPNVDPGSISFAKALVEAKCEPHAYDAGFAALEAEGHERQPNAVMNDWVVDLTELGLRRV